VQQPQPASVIATGRRRAGFVDSAVDSAIIGWKEAPFARRTFARRGQGAARRPPDERRVLSDFPRRRLSNNNAAETERPPAHI